MSGTKGTQLQNLHNWRHKLYRTEAVKKQEKKTIAKDRWFQLNSVTAEQKVHAH